MRVDVHYYGGVPMTDVGAGPPVPTDRRYGNDAVVARYHKLVHWARTADRLGHHTMWLTEHHFQYEGYEVTPNLVLFGTTSPGDRAAARRADVHHRRPVAPAAPGRGHRDGLHPHRRADGGRRRPGHRAAGGAQSRQLGIGVHGGTDETSVVLHLRPDLVDLSLAVRSVPEHLAANRNVRFGGPVSFGWTSDDFGTGGVIGDPTTATPERGRQLWEAMLTAAGDALAEIAAFDPAPPAS